MSGLNQTATVGNAVIIRVEVGAADQRAGFWHEAAMPLRAPHVRNGVTRPPQSLRPAMERSSRMLASDSRAGFSRSRLQPGVARGGAGGGVPQEWLSLEGGQGGSATRQDASAEAACG